MGVYDRKIYLPAPLETGWGTGINANFSRLADVGYNVKAFNAAGNDSTDDTAALQAALNAANTDGGGVVYLPKGVYRHTGLTFYPNTVIQGASGLRGTVTSAPSAASILKYTSSGSGRAYDARDCVGLVIWDVALLYNHPSFTGPVLDLSKNTLTPNAITVERCVIGGETSSSASAAALVNLPGVVNATIRGCILRYGVDGILGRSVSGDITNAIRIENNFNVGSALSGYIIKNAGQGWMVTGNAFEPVGSSAPGAYTEAFQSLNVVWEGNWHGDNTAAGAWLTFQTGTASVGWHIVGNRFAVQDNATGILFQSNSTKSFTIENNFFSGSAGGKGIDFGATGSHDGMIVHPNFASSGVTLLNGTVPNIRALMNDATSIRGEMLSHKVKAGAITDADFGATPADGTIGVDSTNGRLYFRHGGVWHYVTQTA
jgi:hypothetical protein